MGWPTNSAINALLWLVVIIIILVVFIRIIMPLLETATH